MGFEFLSDEHLGQYGKYGGEPTAKQLQDYFLLDPKALKRIAELRHDYTRLGYALQFCTLKFLGTFLANPTAVPDNVTRTLAVQLRLPRTVPFERYLAREDTRSWHQAEIRKLLGFKDFDRVEVLHLMRVLYQHLLVTDERPIVLFDLLTQRLVQRQVILPGATVLAQIVVRVRERVTTRLYRQLAARLDAAQRAALEGLLVIPEGQRRSPLDVLRTAPTRQNAAGLLHALRRIDQLRALGIRDIQLDDLSQPRKGRRVEPQER
ncbi:DUF4158 domain-containing protein [Deinococcus ruber]|uniref:DUF4158 domain-containing protein n=1 Tax=Deinococcus ruber TaxID=1848197 RepID=A0A918CDM1_9DEIO|nr:DUF4158 domain-containing protein [Deinococcus ruber]GGR17674.1 hypothetical protein GCM10008957_32970 [Deinococcus ruber]